MISRGPFQPLRFCDSVILGGDTFTPSLWGPDTVWQQLSEHEYDSWHPTCHSRFTVLQGDCNPLPKVPMKKGFMKVRQSVAFINVYFFSYGVRSGIITCVQSELWAERHKHLWECCSCWTSSTHSFQQDAAAHNWSTGEHTPPGEVDGDPGVRRDLLAQLFISVYWSDLGDVELKRRKMGSTCPV